MKGISNFKENLSRHDIKSLRQRQFVIKDKNPDEYRDRLVNIEVKMPDISSQSVESNRYNPFIKHTPMINPNSNLYKQIMWEHKQARHLRMKQRLGEFEDILLDRNSVQNVNLNLF